jgi:predicted transcriptional regulator
MFRGRWAKATLAEREFMSAIAQVSGHDGIAMTSQLTAVLGKTTPQLSTVRKSLVDKGLIVPTGRGRLRFTMPGFDHYLREQLDLPLRHNDAIPLLGAVDGSAPSVQ